MNSGDSQKTNNIGCWQFPGSEFVYDYRVLFKQTNVMGNTYFSNYIELQGVVRESFLLQHPCALSYLRDNQNIALITHSLYHRFYKNTYFGSCIRVKLKSREIRKYSAMLIFRYFDSETNEKIGEGWQKICFADRLTDQLCEVPQLVLDLLQPILDLDKIIEEE